MVWPLSYWIDIITRAETGPRKLCVREQRGKATSGHNKVTVHQLVGKPSGQTCICLHLLQGTLASRIKLYINLCCLRHWSVVINLLWWPQKTKTKIFLDVTSFELVFTVKITLLLNGEFSLVLFFAWNIQFSTDMIIRMRKLLSAGVTLIVQQS